MASSNIFILYIMIDFTSLYMILNFAPIVIRLGPALNEFCVVYGLIIACSLIMVCFHI